MSEQMVYIGRDLEAMAFAENYHRWILQIFAPYLGTRLVEVGAGTGGVSELLLRRPIESLSLIEPSEKMHEILAKQLKRLNATAQVRTYNSTFASVADEIKRVQRPDSIVYVNVLEHIKDDRSELRLVQQTLCDGGRVFIFVPALQWLYGSFDQQVRHYRRYTKRELEEKCQQAGFRVIESGYFDFIGMIPWWFKYRLLKSDKMEAGAVRFYDRYIVPAAKVVETAVRPPLGKNTFLIAEKV